MKLDTSERVSGCQSSLFTLLRVARIDTAGGVMAVSFNGGSRGDCTWAVGLALPTCCMKNENIKVVSIVMTGLSL